MLRIGKIDGRVVGIAGSFLVVVVGVGCSHSRIGQRAAVGTCSFAGLEQLSLGIEALRVAMPLGYIASVLGWKPVHSLESMKAEEVCSFCGHRCLEILVILRVP